ncbi:MAG: OmpA family protein [Alphaproteobacteria bacterium]|nr:OmpA family protein [Alphaproteobacteria bacterium]
MRGNGPTVVIKKIKKSGHGESHHGGAWKVAYADFVTAMMAFFLLLWLLNVTTDIQKRGIADYFQATLASQSHSGAGGVLGGVSIGQPGAEVVPSTVPTIEETAPTLPSNTADSDDYDPARTPLGDDDRDQGTDNGNKPGHGEGAQPAKGEGSQPDKGQGAKPEKADAAKPLDAKQTAAAEQMLRDREEKQFDAAEHALRQAIQDVPDLKSLAENLLVDRTPEGLRIQIVDQERLSMFPLGSSDMADPARRLMGLVAQVVRKLPNKIAITGHTDATPYARGGGSYGNWELSVDRANASRRELLSDGVAAERVSRVAGVAERDPLVPADPASPRNRRISIVLLHDAPASGLPPRKLAAR